MKAPVQRGMPYLSAKNKNCCEGRALQELIRGAQIVDMFRVEEIRVLVQDRHEVGGVVVTALA